MERNIKEEIYQAYMVLEDMHNSLEDFQYFDKELMNRGRKAFKRLADWDVSDPELQVIVKKTMKLLSCQMDLSDELKKKKEELWNSYRSESLEIKFRA